VPVYGHALIGRALYLPQSWAEDRDRCRGAGILVDIEFATEPRRAQAVISPALEAGVPFAWFTGGACWPGSPGWTPAQRSLKEIEPVNDPLMGQLDLERHGGRITGACMPASSSAC
jgi:DDE superfamily endonuclease